MFKRLHSLLLLPIFFALFLAILPEFVGAAPETHAIAQELDGDEEEAEDELYEEGAEENVEEEEEQPTEPKKELRDDYVKKSILGWVRGLQRGHGDILVFICFIGIALSLHKRRYQGAAGFLLLAAGIVFIRVVLFLLFGDPPPAAG